MDTRALGLIEVKGYLGAIEAADSALKAANVRLIGVEKIKGGLTTVKLGGDVAAVEAAVEAGAAAVSKLNVLLAGHVIARTHEELITIIENGRQPLVEKQGQVIEEPEDVSVPLSKENQVLDEVEPPSEKDQHLQEAAEHPAPEREEQQRDLYQMKVEELRSLARKYRVPNLSRKEIKFGRKEDLIHAIEDFVSKGGN
ncbi:BMC domain-containing protein [Microbacteriaceae bacterium 4G12]